MSYFIYRNEQQYGPYSLQDLQAQIAAGTMVPQDNARSAEGGPWTTVGAILSASSVPTSIAPVPPANPAAAALPLPPNLHWAIVLLITLFFSPFSAAWYLYQSTWIKKIDSQSKASFYVIIGIMCLFLLTGIGVALLLHDPNNPNPWGALPIVVALLCLTVFLILSFFDMRRSMLAYYNTVEPIGLRLSAVMTFFFNIYYLQYHMSRIATWKQTGYLAPQA